MANLVTITDVLISPNNVVIHVGIESDGTQETGLVVYDSSAIATSLGRADTLNCKLLRTYHAVSSASGFIKLQFDATTSLLATSFPAYSTYTQKFEQFGGIPDMAGTGKTGDLTLTTTGLAAGDSFMLVLEVYPA